MYLNTPTSLRPEAREQVGSILNHALADEFALSAAARDFHWNVTGPNSRSLNELFGQQYSQVDQWIEKIANRARSVGITARSGWAELIKAPRFTPSRGADLTAQSMLKSLAELHEFMAETLRRDSEACAPGLGDPLTAEMLAELADYHETSAWMLGELLGEDRQLAEAGEENF
jgi:starvation-inducible DNA-binding protein